MADTSAKPGRRWFRFSLRTLFVAVTIPALLCFVGPPAFSKYQAWKAEREFRELIRLIETTIVVSSGPWDQPEASPAPPADPPAGDRQAQPAAAGFAVPWATAS